MALADVEAAPERTVYGFEPGDGEAFDTVVAWWRNPYRRLRRVERVAELLDGGAPFFLLVRADNVAGLASLLPRLTLRGEVAPPAPASDHDRYRVYAPASPR
jgi:hypothetical protein